MKFEFTGNVENFDGNTIRQERDGRFPWVIGLFSTKGEGMATRLDQEMQLGFDLSFLASRDSQVLAVTNEAAKTGRIRVTIEAVEE